LPPAQPAQRAVAPCELPVRRAVLPYGLPAQRAGPRVRPRVAPGLRVVPAPDGLPVLLSPGLVCPEAVALRPPLAMTPPVLPLVVFLKVVSES